MLGSHESPYIETVTREWLSMLEYPFLQLGGCPQHIGKFGYGCFPSETHASPSRCRFAVSLRSAREPTAQTALDYWWYRDSGSRVFSRSAGVAFLLAPHADPPSCQAVRGLRSQPALLDHMRKGTEMRSIWSASESWLVFKIKDGGKEKDEQFSITARKIFSQ